MPAGFKLGSFAVNNSPHFCTRRGRVVSTCRGKGHVLFTFGGNIALMGKNTALAVREEGVKKTHE
jgi:hypothetical protein